MRGSGWRPRWNWWGGRRCGRLTRADPRPVDPPSRDSLFLAATIAVAAAYSPLFAAGDIRLDAPDGMTRADVLAVARVTDRSNVFHLDAGAIEQRLERDPRILRATVTTSLPNRIAIEVVPRTAVASWGRAGNWWAPTAW